MGEGETGRGREGERGRGGEGAAERTTEDERGESARADTGESGWRVEVRESYWKIRKENTRSRSSNGAWDKASNRGERVGRGVRGVRRTRREEMGSYGWKSAVRGEEQSDGG